MRATKAEYHTANSFACTSRCMKSLRALHVVTFIVREFMIPCHLKIAKNRYPNCIRLDWGSGGFRIQCSPRPNVKFDF